MSEKCRPKFLLDEPFHLCHAPSLSVWDLLRQRPARPITRASILAIADYPQRLSALPGARKDRDNFRAVFGDRVRADYFGETAHVTHAQELLRQPGLVLVSTHGENNPDQPLASHLSCYPDRTRLEGLLTAADLYAGRGDADLVVLSSCYSGLGDRSPLPGDDLFGLQRALLHSGVRTVVSGLWDVCDATAPELMRRFFERLREGACAPEALAGAQRAYLKKRRAATVLIDDEPGQGRIYLHPYFWAVFTVAGDDRTRFEK